jgi:hypothetical protein
MTLQLSGSTSFPQWPTTVISLAAMNAFLAAKNINLTVTAYDNPAQVLKIVIENV